MIEIKPAGIEIIETVRQLAHEIWPTAYSEILSEQQVEYMLDKMYSYEALRHQIKVLKHQFIIISENEKPIGFASFSVHEDDPTIFHLNKIYVLPQQQGKNTGKKLLEYVIYKIKESDATTLQLNVNRNNKALHFYKKIGFKIIREEDIDIGNGYFMNDYVMALDV